jgi:hypothetical protein
MPNEVRETKRLLFGESLESCDLAGVEKDATRLFSTACG